MKHVLLPIAVVANLAMTTPIVERAPELLERTSGSISELATFDDLTPNPVPALSTIPYPYHDLGFVDLYNMQGTLSGVRPHSPPNYAANGPATKTPGNVIFSNINTNVTSFDFHSFYYGCLVATDTLLSTACAFTAGAYATGSGVHVGSTSFQYKPGSLTNATMMEATFGSTFSGLEEVALTLTSSDATVENTILVIDSIQYVVYVE